ncbi:hypothetical protein C5167_007016 [Papaver somniferum]|uniref:Uncharacterized protein n=1 Tax=Papaver somniferum TaxID=3469 RepID=A0A4Y7JIX7_PAPSO|nr:hypothetical protein C5167_007016 [Papaver somniferum]
MLESVHSGAVIDKDDEEFSDETEKMSIKKLAEMLEMIQLEIEDSKSADKAGLEELRHLASMGRSILEALQGKLSVQEEENVKLRSGVQILMERSSVQEEEMLKLRSGVQILTSTNAARILQKQQPKYIALSKLTIAGSVCSVVGLGLIVLWRKQDVAAKRRDKEMKARQQASTNEQYEEVVINQKYDWVWIKKQFKKHRPMMDPRPVMEEKGTTVMSELGKQDDDFDWSELGRTFPLFE